MTNNSTPRTVEDAEIRTNVREVVKFIGIILTVGAFVWSIKSDIKDLATTSEFNKKVTEIRLQAIELRLLQIEQEQKEHKKQKEIELQKKADKL